MGFLQRLFGTDDHDSSHTYSLPRADNLHDLLPRITDEHLSREFTEEFSRGTYGPGESRFWEGLEFAKRGDDKGATEAWSDAIAIGLNGILLANANANSGQMYIDLGMFPEAVDSFIACLLVSPKPAAMAWQSAARLSYFYDSAGRPEELDALGRLAEDANNALPSRQKHMGDVIKRHGEFALDYSEKLGSGLAPPSHWLR